MIIQKKILNILKNNNITPVLVGGSVRDDLINILKSSDEKLNFKDIDIEIYGKDISYDLIVSLLSEYNPKIVGKQFGVIKINVDNIEYDISFPRKENSNGMKHTDFNIEIDSNLSYVDAFKRRDFTINAIGKNLLSNETIDLYNGKKDIENKIIKHVDAKTFVEDPLRIFRAIQFASRFNFKISNNTKELIHKMIKNNMLDNLPRERIFEEFNKLLMKSKKPSIGFELMNEFGILKRYFPEIYDLKGVEQNPKWHPEGDVYIHTLMALDQMASLNNPKIENKLIHMYSVLAHDFGKPFFTKIKEDGTITSQGHEKGGIEPTIKFMNRLTGNQDFIIKISKLVEFHLIPSLIYKKAKKGALIKLSNKLLSSDPRHSNLSKSELTLVDLAIINKADSLGRTTKEALNKTTPQYDWLIEQHEKLLEQSLKIKSLITGNDLIKIGMKPGKEFKQILNDCYDYQIDNNIEIKEEMNNYLTNKLISEELDINNIISN